MKTTLNFDDRLILAARIRAAEERNTLTRLIERALRDDLQAASQLPAHRYRVTLLTRKGNPLAGVNLDDRRALYDFIDGRDRLRSIKRTVCIPAENR